MLEDSHKATWARVKASLCRWACLVGPSAHTTIIHMLWLLSQPLPLITTLLFEATACVAFSEEKSV